MFGKRKKKRQVLELQEFLKPVISTFLQAVAVTTAIKGREVPSLNDDRIVSIVDGFATAAIVTANLDREVADEAVLSLLRQDRDGPELVKRWMRMCRDHTFGPFHQSAQNAFFDAARSGDLEGEMMKLAEELFESI